MTARYAERVTRNAVTVTSREQRAETSRAAHLDVLAHSLDGAHAPCPLTAARHRCAAGLEGKGAAAIVSDANHSIARPIDADLHRVRATSNPGRGSFVLHPPSSMQGVAVDAGRLRA